MNQENRLKLMLSNARANLAAEREAERKAAETDPVPVK